MELCVPRAGGNREIPACFFYISIKRGAFYSGSALRSQRKKAECRGGEENRRPFHEVKALCVRFRRRGVRPRENALRMVLRNFCRQKLHTYFGGGRKIHATKSCKHVFRGKEEKNPGNRKSQKSFEGRKIHAAEIGISRGLRTPAFHSGWHERSRVWLMTVRNLPAGAGRFAPVKGHFAGSGGRYLERVTYICTERTGYQCITLKISRL